MKALRISVIPALYPGQGPGIIRLLLIVLVAAGTCCSCNRNDSEKADLILFNGEVYTMEDSQPWARAVAIRGNRILAVTDQEKEYRKYKNRKTRVIDMKGKFVMPGFIDANTRFNNAGAMILGVNLLEVSDADGLRNEVWKAVRNLEMAEWITGGFWGACEQRKKASAGEEKNIKEQWKPDRWMIDDLTPDNPVLLWNYDRSMYLANSIALELSGLDYSVAEGMEYDEEKGPTGLIYSTCEDLQMVLDMILEKSPERLMKENLAALRRLAECGITEIHDIVTPGQMERFQELEHNGELTCRVWARPDLSRVDELTGMGIRMGDHPVKGHPGGLLRYGALKGSVEGIMGTQDAFFAEPYTDQPETYGHYRPHSSDDPELLTGNMDKMYRMIIKGYDQGFVSNVDAIGTRGVSLMLDTYERLTEEVGHDLEGFSIIHAQVDRSEDFPRFKKLNVIAEVNPYHLSDELRWMDERIGDERCRGGYALKSLLDNGAILSFGSDWPGTTAAVYHCHPKYLLHAAVNRTTLDGEPEGGWFPEQKISMHEALKAYTINNAYAAFEAELRGSIKAGKLADITVVDRNLIKIRPEEILDMQVEMTIVDGKIVFDAALEAP